MRSHLKLVLFALALLPFAAQPIGLRHLLAIQPPK
jgi:hypothetical protein